MRFKFLLILCYLSFCHLKVIPLQNREYVVPPLPHEQPTKLPIYGVHFLWLKYSDIRTEGKLLLWKQSMLIYQFKCQCGTTYFQSHGQVAVKTNKTGLSNMVITVVIEMLQYYFRPSDQLKPSLSLIVFHQTDCGLFAYTHLQLHRQSPLISCL